MSEQNWMELLSEQNQLQKIMEGNRFSERFGLVLTQKDAELLLDSRKNILKEYERIELGAGILPRLIYTFPSLPLP